MEALSWLLGPESMKQKIRRNRGGSGDKGVGSDGVSLLRPSGGQACRPHPCHPVAERQPTSTGWLPLEAVSDAMFVRIPTACEIVVVGGVGCESVVTCCLA